MAVMKIYSLDDIKEQDVVSTLSEGEHIIGRGALLNCYDKRISRKHALINVHKDMASIKAVHVNPCFFKEAKGNSITVLPKDTSVMLNDGDQFAFLADLFWFRVRLFLDDNNDTSLQNTSHAELNGTKEAEKNTVNMSEQADNIPSSKRSLEEENSIETCKRQKTPNEESDVLDTSSNRNELSIDRQPVDETKIDSTRLIDNVLSIVEEDYGIKSETNRNQDIGKVSNLFGGNTSDAVACCSNSSRVQIEENIRTEDVLDRDEATSVSNNLMVRIKEEKTDENIKHEDSDNGSTTKIKEEISKDSETRQDVPTPTDEIEKTGEASSSNKLPVDTVKKEEKGISPDEEEAEKDQGQNGASCSKDNENKRRRERCWYGPACYRKNPIHRADFSHPGDDDYDSDPDDDRPVCPFGAACYRKNIDHRRQYKHPNPPAAKPNDGGDGKPKRKRKSPKKKAQTDNGDSEEESDADDGTPKKRVTRKPKYEVDYDSEDEYDLNDPFIDDASSDEFVLSEDGDSDDDSTEWEDSQAVSEESQETRRLLKEAKRFAKAKKKK